MSATWQNEGINLLARAQWDDAITVTPLVMRLFTNTTSIAATDTWAGGQRTECALTGYAGITLAYGSWSSITASAGVVTGVYPTQTYTFSAYAGGTTIYGYMITCYDGAAIHYVAAEMIASPYLVPSAGGSLQLALTWTNGQR